MVSVMNISFILLIIYALLCGLYDFLGIFIFFGCGALADLFVSITSVIGAILVVIVSLRGIREVTKLGQQAFEDEKAKDILVKIFSGGIVFMLLIFFALLNW